MRRHFIEEAIKRAEVDEYLARELERAGYGGIEVTKAPLGTHVTIYATRPGLVIGKGGDTIKELTATLEEKFSLPNPQISVVEMEIPEVNPHVMATRIADALKRGVHFRRVGFWALQKIMDAGAIGAEIRIKGKLRTKKTRFEKYKAGYVPKTGEDVTTQVLRATVNVDLVPGTVGIEVVIVPPGSKFADYPERAEKKEVSVELEEGGGTKEGEGEG
ncbi:MAG: 30S ribosomal protein S3 [Candidatus Bathyarchaeia archaeon]